MRKFQGLLAVGTIIAMAGCASAGSSEPQAAATDWDSVAEIANDEGRVVVYISQNPANFDAVVSAFGEEYPEIDLELVHGLDSEIVPRVETEQRTGQMTADVIITSNSDWIADAQDAFVEVQSPRLSDGAYDADLFAPDSTSFVVSAAVQPFGWNTDLVDTPPESYEDLLAEEFANGRLGVISPSTSPTLVDFYSHVLKHYGDDFLDRLAAQSPRQYAGVVPLLEALSSGEIAASIYLSVPALESAIAAGAPVDYQLDDHPWGARFHAANLVGAPHPNAGQIFSDFLLSPEGQTAFAAGMAAVLPDTPGAVAFVGDIPPMDPATQEPEFVREFGNRWASSIG